MANPYEIANIFGSGAQGFIKGMQDAENMKMKKMELEALQKARDDEFERNKLVDAINMRKAGLAKNEAGELVDTPEALQERSLDAEYKRAQINKLQSEGFADPDRRSPLKGYKLAGGEKLDSTSRRQLRASEGAVKSFNNTLDDLAKKVSDASEVELANPLSNKRKEIDAVLKELQLLYKGEDFAKLGVLAGPDMAILDKVIENPGSISNLIGGRSGVVNRYQQLKDRVNKNYMDKLGSYGLEIEEGAPDPMSYSKYNIPKDGGLIRGILTGGMGLVGSEANADTPTSGPKVGSEEDGYIFTGGDPKDKKNWKKAK